MRKTCVQTVEIQWLTCATEHNLCTRIRSAMSPNHIESRNSAQYTTQLPTVFPQHKLANLPSFIADLSALSTGPITTTTNIFNNS